MSLEQFGQRKKPRGIHRAALTLCQNLVRNNRFELLDEQHFLVLWQRPNIVGNDRFQRVCDFANRKHRRLDDVVEVLGFGRQIVSTLVVGRVVESVDRFFELGNHAGQGFQRPRCGFLPQVLRSAAILANSPW